MNIKTGIISLAFLSAALCGWDCNAKSYKRGVSENQFSLAQQLDVLQDGVSWYYTWGNTPPKGYENGVIDHEGLEFVPMCWNGSFDADNIREYCKTHPQTKYILGFNEPNFTKQANMTPQKAAEKWPEVVALARELGLKIVAPALNYSPNPPYTDPTKWMDEFTALVGSDAYDFVAVHNYGGIGVMKTLTTTFHERYGKPVWLTEFCYWPGEAGYVAPKTQIASMVECLNWLEKTPWIYRYAWFKALGKHDSPDAGNFALVITESGLGERTLSEQGLVYVNMTDLNEDNFLEIENEYAAKDYIDAELISLGASANPEKLSPIEISQFNSGASVTWQFDVAEAGEYFLMLNITGVGEPDRFDPSLSVKLVNNDNEPQSTLCEATSFSLPGNDNEYKWIKLPVNLYAGKQRLMLCDEAKYRPSGIRISSVKLTKAAGIDAIAGVEKNVKNIYTVDGREIKTDNPSETLGTLSPGIYIFNNKKIIIK